MNHRWLKNTFKCSLLSLYGSINQIPSMFHLTPMEMTKINNINYITGWQGCGEWETVIHSGGSVNWYIHHGNQCVYSLEMWKLSYLKVQLYHSWTKDCTSFNRNFYSPMFIVALWIIVSNWWEPRCLPTGEWIMKIW